MTISDLLQAHGFRPAGTCRCDGYFTLKFRKGIHEVKWRKSRYTFKVMEYSSTLHNWQTLENLQNILNELDTQKIKA